MGWLALWLGAVLWLAYGVRLHWRFLRALWRSLR